jgi:hypothetical protein
VRKFYKAGYRPARPGIHLAVLKLFYIVLSCRWTGRLDIIIDILYTHCNENPTYVSLFWEQRGLSPNFHIHVSVIDLYSPRIGLHISSSRIGRPMVEIYKSLTDAWMWKLGLRPPRYSSSGNVSKYRYFVFAVQEKY